MSTRLATAVIYGQLGHGNTATQLTPFLIAGLEGVCVRLVAAGRTTSLAITSDGEAYGWLGLGWCACMWMELDPVLGLELTEQQLVPLQYAELCLHP